MSLQGHEELAIPHVSVPDIRWVDWQAVKRAGFEGAAFDKDNTLTLPYIGKVSGGSAFALSSLISQASDWHDESLRHVWSVQKVVGGC